MLKWIKFTLFLLVHSLSDIDQFQLFILAGFGVIVPRGLTGNVDHVSDSFGKSVWNNLKNK